MYTVNVFYCTYECVHVSAYVFEHSGKKAFYFTLSFSPFTLILVGPLIKSFKPFYPLNDILK